MNEIAGIAGLIAGGIAAPSSVVLGLMCAAYTAPLSRKMWIGLLGAAGLHLAFVFTLHVPIGGLYISGLIGLVFWSFAIRTLFRSIERHWPGASL